MSKFPQSFHFNLPNPLTGHLEIFAHFFQRSLTALGVQPKSQADDLFFSGTQSLENIACNVTQVRRDYAFMRIDG